MTSALRMSWKDVQNEIRDAILSGRYGPGDRLPRDADIAERLKCGRSTVQRAMQGLSDLGLVERRRKGGTRVRSDPVTRATLDIPITRREIERKGSEYGYRLIRAQEEVTSPNAACALDLPEPRRMLHVEALHLSDGRPYIFEDRWICTATSPEILAVDLENRSANEWLVLNKPYSRCDVRFYAVCADARFAELLGTHIGAALLVIERTTWIASAPITTVRAFTVPDYQVVATSEQGGRS